jgi:hypothetical protein
VDVANPHAVHETPLHDQKVGVWVVTSRWRIVGPLFFEERVNIERYCSMLYDFISLFEEDEITYSWFQQDGATAHTANNSMKLLRFLENVSPLQTYGPIARWILFHQTFIYGEQQNLCDRPRMLNDLKTAITAYIRNISQADQQEVSANKIKRIQTCINACGHHFQHLL